MIKIRILQIGDVHMGQARVSGLDQKDRLYPAPVALATTPDPLQSAARLAVNILRLKPVDAILLVGDLAHQGDQAQYQNCVDYLVQLFVGDWCKLNSSSAAFCVPGNHDIDRSKIQVKAAPADIWKKFEPLEAAWGKHGLPILASNSVRQFQLKKGKAIANLLALNSCLGCGEYRGLPDHLAEAAHDFVTNATDAKAKWETIEQIDSPAFAFEHVETVQQSISGEKQVNVFVAHHNLLPQATPRAALYAELLNGGQFRSVLTNAKNPSLYCHGHIHDDPVEIVKSAEGESAPTVAISAPMLDQGFNVIEIVFSDDGLPLGTVVQKYKIARSNTFSPDPVQEIRIPFNTSAQYIPKLYEPPRSKMVEIVRTEGGVRFPELLEKIRGHYTAVTAGELESMLQEAEWYGVVKILDRDKESSFWQMIRAST